ncbi:hypothetical protein HS7_18590 [Sulfolobales archaeon HS-7]|nr:hypothetical protein HS7_18590 [Sulfolobales archaeon HS-7]
MNYEVLMCPRCGGDVKIEKDRVVCILCKREYAFVNGVLDMLEDKVSWIGFFERHPRFYDVWSNAGWFLFNGRKYSSLIKDVLEGFNKGILLDAATGTGAVLRSLMSDSGIGIDLSLPMLTYAKSKVKSLLIRGSIEKLPIKSESIDFYTCNMALHILNDKSKVFAEMSRVLKKGGIASVSVITKDNLKGSIMSRAFGLKDYSENDYINTASNEGLTLYKRKRVGPVSVIKFYKGNS